MPNPKQLLMPPLSGLVSNGSNCYNFFGSSIGPFSSPSMLMPRIVFALLAVLLLLPGVAAVGQPTADAGTPLPFNPRQYVAYRTATPIAVDGMLTDSAWAAAPWTDVFVDIEGNRRPAPRYRTRAKMLWDETYFYFAAEMEEPHVWATLTERDAVIFHDNDFEIFIDPDGDTHGYYELEINALGTVWDLMLIKPYRDGGPAVDGWDVSGLLSGVYIDGTLNTPGDTDRRWTVEVAMPWRAFNEIARRETPPAAGTQWRVNFSRVQWQLDIEEERYVKRLDPETGKPFPEDNWVWSPQGAINMHMPERWGYVQFSDRVAGKSTEAFVEDPNERVRWALRQLYYRQQAYVREHHTYADDLKLLNAETITLDGRAFEPTLWVTASMYEITAPGFGGKTLHIRHDGKVWEE